MRAWFVLFLIVVPGLSTAKEPGSGGSIRYDDLPRLVREKNENVQAAHSTLKAQDERTGRFTRSLLPSLSAQIGTEEFKTGADESQTQEFWKLEARINLYRGGKDRLEDEIRKTHVSAAQSDFSREYNQELKEARQTYWKLVAIARIITDRKEGSERNEANLKSAKRRAGAGVATAADTVQFELQKTLLNQDLKKLQLQQDLLKNRLSVAIGLNEHETFVIEDNFPHPDEGPLNVADMKAEDQLDVKILKARAEGERLRRKQNSKWWQPRLDLYSSYGLPSLSEEYTRALRRDREWAAGVRVGFDLGQGIEDRSEARAKEWETQAASQRASHRAREAVASDHEVRHDLKLLHELIHDADRDIEKAERFMKLTEGEYSRGVKNGPDLLEAFQKLYEFRQRRTELYREYHESKAELISLVAKEEAP
jgi:outer membrane protein